MAALAEAVKLRDASQYLAQPVFAAIDDNLCSSNSLCCSNYPGEDISGDNSTEGQAIRSAVDIFPLLTPHSLWDLHLEMYEPAIEALTEGLDDDTTNQINAASVPIKTAVKFSWLDWFDGLTNHKTAIDAALAKL